MPGLRLATLVRRLRRDTAADGAGVSDAELLARFVKSRDDAAFELLVWRHGAMVLAACRRVLGNPDDAEDAFQAVFLVLARRAASVARGAALPAWLHRVALRLSFRLARSRRPAAELVVDPPAAVGSDSVERADLRGVLDAEIDNLPEHCRRAVVLCYLEGLSGSEAARLLGCPTGTVESRLAAARKRLRDRLTRRGVTLPVGILALVAAPAGLAAEVVTRTARAGVAAARDGLNAAAGMVREPAIQLAKGALVMVSARTWAGLILGAAMVAVAAGVGWANQPADDGPNGVAAVPEVAPEPAPKEQAKSAALTEAWPLARQIRGAEAVLVGVASDGKSVILRTSGGAPSVYDVSLDGKTSRFDIRSPNRIDSAALSPDGKLVATAEGSNGVKLRDAATGKMVEALWPTGGLPAEQVAFTPDGAKLVVVCWRTEAVESKFPGKKGVGGKDTGGQRFSPAKSTKRVQVSVWDVAGRKELGHPVETTTAEESYLPRYSLCGNGRFVLKAELVAVPQDDRPASVGRRFTVIDALSGAAGKPLEITGPYRAAAYPDALSPDGKTLALVTDPEAIIGTDISARKSVRLVDVATGKDRATLGPLPRPIKAFTFSPDGKRLAAATGVTTTRQMPGGGLARVRDDQTAAPTGVVIWDAATGKELARLVDPESNRDYTAVRFAPDGSFLVTQDEGHTLILWGHPPEPSEAEQPPGKGKGGKGKGDDSGPVKGKGKGKAIEPPPAAPPAAGVPDRFAALFRDLSADGVTDQRRVESVFLAALGRLPTDVESRTLAAQLAKRADKPEALKDLLGTLVETAEFKAHAEALGRLAK